jgi:uncharacterized membrane protein
MDFNWWPYMSGLWIFPLLCMVFMVVMMVVGGRMCFGFRHRRSGRVHESARDILQRRYASGEIGKAEYDALRRDVDG